MGRTRFVVAIAVTVVLSTVGGAIAGGIVGNFTEVAVELPIFYKFTGNDDYPVGTLGFAPGTNRLETPAGEFPERESGEEAFMFTQIVGGPRNLTVSTKYQPNRGSFLVRLSKPAPASGVRLIYNVVRLGAP